MVTAFACMAMTGKSESRSVVIVWRRQALKKGMRDRDAAKRKAMASNDPRDLAKYKKLRNTINNNIKTLSSTGSSIVF